MRVYGLQIIHSQCLHYFLYSTFVIGPRIYASGAFISNTGGHGDTGCCFDAPGDMDRLEENGLTYICDSVDEVKKAVRNNFRNGATQVSRTICIVSFILHDAAQMMCLKQTYVSSIL